jgi:hypothetical protein
MFPIGPAGTRISIAQPGIDAPPARRRVRRLPAVRDPTQYCVIWMAESTAIAGRIVSILDQQYERTQ